MSVYDQLRKYIYCFDKIDKSIEIVQAIIPPRKSKNSKNNGSFSTLSFIYTYHSIIKLGIIHSENNITLSIKNHLL